MKISTAVVERLIGYASMIVLNVLLSGKMVFIHVIRTPQTPMVVSIAGRSEMPNPRR